MSKPVYSAYDVEAGGSPPGSAALAGSGSGLGATARGVRRVVIKNVKLIVITVGALIFLSYITDVGPGSITSMGRGPPPHRHPPDWIGDDDELDDEWDGGPPGGHGGGGWKLPLPFGRPKRPPPPPHYDEDFDDVTPSSTEFVIDEHGNRFFPHWDHGIAPMHPDISLLPPPSSLFPEVDLPTFLRPPTVKPFPADQIRQIVSDPPNIAPESVVAKQELPANSFARQWVRPEVWDPPRGEVKRVQWEGFDGHWSDWETESEREVREERKEAVRRGFAWAWQAYKDHAWGHDEIRPVDKTPSDPFNNWGASIVDTLDTLLVMGFSEEYELCRPHVNQLNFHWIGGRDWSQAYENPVDEDGEIWAVHRDKATGLPVFETGIRYLGGMLGAYDLSGDSLLLERAVDLARILGKAFETASGLPAGRIDPGAEQGIYSLSMVSLAEVGSMALELIRLSYATGDRHWFDLAHRATEFLDQRVVPRSTQTPLIPMWFAPNAAVDSKMTGGYTFGGLADSYYEYLVKAYKLMGASELASTYRKLYEGSIEAAKKLLYTDITVVPGRDLMTIGKYENNRLIHETEHLTCFAGAMLGLGAKLLDRDQDMDDAQRFTKTCYWLSANTATGLQPEVFEFFTPQDMLYQNVTIPDGGVYHPPVRVDEVDEIDTRVAHMDRTGKWRYNVDGEEVVRPEDAGPVEYAQKLRGTPPGAKKVSGRGINRPETIESIFYMYRLTGDRKWQEKGWKMFVSWVTTAKVDGGISSVEDVTKAKVRYSNNMESFMFAETLKYHFLLQSEPDVLNLDDYVLNTEAHPLLTSPIKPGSQGLYRPSSSSVDLGVRGQGTDAQKWVRLGVLDTARESQARSKARAKGKPVANDQVGGGGGRGMGGGGGRPGVVPGRVPSMAKVN